MYRQRNPFDSQYSPEQIINDVLPKLRKSLLGIIAVLIGIWVVSSCWFRVQEHEEALVYQLGRADRQVQKGFHWKLPWPFETVSIQPTRITQQLTFGYREEGGEVVPIPDEALMITGDENLVWADLLVEWKISDIRKFENAAENPELLLKYATAASLRSVVGTKELEAALTTGKFEIQSEVQRLLTELMTTYDVGISIESVKLQDIEPPDAVKDAFKSVNDAREQRNTRINEAEKYRNERLPVARGEAQKLIEDALARKAQRINTAMGDVAKYKALLEAYEANPEITKQRLIMETLETILPGAEIVILDNRNGTLQYLPIDVRR